MLLVTGGSGLIGSALKQFLAAGTLYAGHRDCDLTSVEQTVAFFGKHRPRRVIHLAARLAGSDESHERGAELFVANSRINQNVFEACARFRVEKILSCSSTAAYPDVQCATEDQLHAGPPNDFNAGYSYMKRMLHLTSALYRRQYGLNSITCVTNMTYGENDTFSVVRGRFVGSVVKKIADAVARGDGKVVFYGDPGSRREFTYAPDVAKTMAMLLSRYDDEESINVGCTDQHALSEVVDLVAANLGYEGRIEWTGRQDQRGATSRTSSNRKLVEKFGAVAYTPLEAGIKNVCQFFRRHGAFNRCMSLRQ